jgi:hypothetical protein
LYRSCIASLAPRQAHFHQTNRVSSLDSYIRDPDSTTYTGAIETAVEFGKRIYREAVERGWSRAKKQVVIGEGAEWIWSLVAEHFPGAIEIVDLYHARQHLWAVARQPILTIVGPARLSRPYYLCSQCHQGQFPVDVELDIANTEFSPGVRRMHALVGQQAPFDHGREQMQVLAGLAVTTKSVERIAETIGGDVAQREQAEREKALQLDLPVCGGDPIPILYVQMDGTGIPVVKKETVGRPGNDGQPAHTREVKLGCVFTQTSWNEQGFALYPQEEVTAGAANCSSWLKAAAPAWWREDRKTDSTASRSVRPSFWRCANTRASSWFSSRATS